MFEIQQFPESSDVVFFLKKNIFAFFKDEVYFRQSDQKRVQSR